MSVFTDALNITLAGWTKADGSALGASDIAAITAGLTGGGSAFGPLIDEALTGAATWRSVKSMAWSAGTGHLALDLTERIAANDNRIQSLKEAA